MSKLGFVVSEGGVLLWLVVEKWYADVALRWRDDEVKPCYDT